MLHNKCILCLGKSIVVGLILTVHVINVVAQKIDNVFSFTEFIIKSKFCNTIIIYYFKPLKYYNFK